MTRFINYCGLRIEYDYVPKNIKNAYIRIKKDGEISVTTPLSYTGEMADSFVEQTQPQVLFVPNRSALSTKVTAGWVKNHMPGAALYFSGDGTVTMLTDGTDWYIEQAPNYVDPQ